jgi:hypothetical protein
MGFNLTIQPAGILRSPLAQCTTTQALYTIEVAATSEETRYITQVAQYTTKVTVYTTEVALLTTLVAQ